MVWNLEPFGSATRGDPALVIGPAPDDPDPDNPRRWVDASWDGVESCIIPGDRLRKCGKLQGGPRSK